MAMTTFQFPGYDTVRLVRIGGKRFWVNWENSQIGEVERQTAGWFAYGNRLFDEEPTGGPFPTRDVAVRHVLRKNRVPKG